MKFKIDENLPVEIKEILQAAEHDALTVHEQSLSGAPDPRISDVCLQERRVLVTLDLDFADIRSFPPEKHPGIMVIRVHRQDKNHIIEVFNRTIPLMKQEPIEKHLWIIEESQVRIRGGSKGVSSV